MKHRILIATVLYVTAAIFFITNSQINSQIQSLENEVYLNEAQTAAQITKILNTPAVFGSPTSLYLPRLNHSVNVEDGNYDYIQQEWTLTRNNAHISTETNKLNNDKDGGLTFIYGHNNSTVFGITKNLVQGDVLEIKTKEGHIFSYRYVDDEIVSPDNTSLFKYSGDPKLVLMSCTGEWNESRRIMNFELIGVAEDRI